MVASKQWELDQKREDLKLSIANREETLREMRYILATLERWADQHRRDASTITIWLLSSSLAANLAGIWAMMSQRGLDVVSFHWSLTWFGLGAAASLVTGATRAGVEIYNAQALTKIVIAEMGVRAEVAKSMLRSQHKAAAVSVGVAAVGTVSVVAFFIGAAVALSSRL